jgi:hypothetical protein
VLPLKIAIIVAADNSKQDWPLAAVCCCSGTFRGVTEDGITENAITLIF